MKNITTNQIRKAFLDYFAANGHAILPSSPLVPHNDPTLMFTNSGMVQFKNIFTGTEQPKVKRATTSQKCVRAGGKHNDLDNVGYTARHHTFFEMLGNFSFADYFKEAAIPFAWEFLTRELGLPKEKLLVTIYHDDEEAYGLWKKTAGLSDDKIIRINSSDNFWSMGDTGPCGPCSEIFYDHGDSVFGGPPGSKDADGDRFIEIWNLVFMQYEQVDKNTRNKLPKPCIDTGMGIERVAAVLQGVHNNYDTDTFRHIIAAAEQIARVKAEGEKLASYRIIADHLRSACFLLADGVMPSNEGRGYVLRRIMRRAMRHVHQLGFKDVLMHQLVPVLIGQMGDAYPELGRASALMQATIKSEEERFRTTLERGLALLADESGKVGGGNALSGEVAFKLYDTYGFPVDLTADILRGQGKSVDMAGFESAMQKQKEMARAAWSGSGDKATGKLWFELKEKAGASEFLGYSADSASGTITAIVKAGQQITAAAKGDEIELIANQTPFYGESGGQLGDIGCITTAGGAVLKVTDTKKPLPDLIVHRAVVENGEVKAGDVATFTIDSDYRNRLRRNHSAAHLLHHVLRKYLGEHVTQQGSLVAHDRFRFDFSHPKALNDEQIEHIEREVNAMIWQNSDVATIITSPEEAVKKGAMALFGEKYGDEVRVVSMGDSIELCGGTHVSRTGDIGMFVVTEESSIAAGVRRVEALVWQDAFDYMKKQESAVQGLAASFNCSADEASARAVALLDDKKKLEKEISSLKTKLAMGGASGGNDKPEDIGGIPFLAKIVDGLPAKELRGVAEQCRQSAGSSVITVISTEGNSASVVVSVSDDYTNIVSANDLFRIGSAAFGGKGGGKPNFAQGGIPAGKVDDMVEGIKKGILNITATKKS